MNMIKRIEPTLYQADSKSDPDHSHIIYLDTTTNEWICDCIGYKYRQSCRHIKEILLDIGEKKNETS